MSLMYKVCMRTISRGGYPEDMALRINVFFGATDPKTGEPLLTSDEYNELMRMLNT